MKQRMASADVAGEVSCLKQKIIGLRLANLYDLNAKTYVLKLAKSGSDGEKVFLLLESGTRFHTVQVMYDKPDAPSNFTLKLRKHLRTRRLEDVRQLGVDRVVDFVFGTGENAHHLILEMYAQGNVILTDHNYQILTLLRSHRDDDKGRSTMARHPYPMHAIRLRQPLALQTLRAALEGAGAAAASAAASAGGGDGAGGAGAAGGGGGGEDGGVSGIEEGSDDEGGDTTAAAGAQQANGAAASSNNSNSKKQQQQPPSEKPKGWKGAAAGGVGGKGSTTQGPILKSIVAELVPYGPAIAEHCCLSAGLQPQHPVAAAPLSEAQVGALYAAVQGFEGWLAGLDAGAEAEGFIAAQHTAGGGGGGDRGSKGGSNAQQQQQLEQVEGEQKKKKEGGGGGLVYQDYNPLRLQASKSVGEVLTFTTFDEALDEYYGKIQGQRVEVAKLDAERAALSRLDKIRVDQGARAAALEKEAAASEERASLIEYNLEAVDAAIDAVNAAIATGMDWRELEALIREERRSGNPVAGAIHSLQLDQNKITLLLSNLLDTEEDDEEALTRPATKVQVDLGMSAYSNAAAHHAARKKQQVKQEKTLAAHAEALKAAEKKAAAQLANLRTSGPAATVLRKPAWYERFHWFISSENYLVISGHDAQQNELIVKRYFRKNDVYVHAELHGASSTIVRNHDPSRPVPPLTLQQAGCACVCRSRAWDAKLVTSAWWVHHHQVSKTAPTGEYLPTGSFMVRGKKNFLPPQGLVMGLGFMFKLEDSCIGRHVGERAVRGGLDDDGGGEGGEGEGGRADRQQQQRVSGASGGGVSEGDDDDEDEEEGGSQAGSSSQQQQPQQLSAAGSSATSALDAFLDMSADTLAAAATATTTTAAAGGGGVLRHSGSSSSRGYERYGLEHPAVVDDGEGGEGQHEGEGEGQQPGGGKQGESKRYVSAAERARLKKAGKGSSSSLNQQAQQLPPSKQQQQPPPSKQQQQKGGGGGQQGGKGGGKPPAGPSAAAAPLSQSSASQRGKKGKAAKAKEKYAEQDEEDRELALQLLASSGAKKSRQDRRQARKAAKEEARQARDAGSGLSAGGPQGSSRADLIKRATGSQFADMHNNSASAAAEGAEDGEGGSSSGGSEAGAPSTSSSQPTQQQQEGGGGGAGSGSSMVADSKQQQQQGVSSSSQRSSSSTKAGSARRAPAAAAAAADDDQEDDSDEDAAAKELAAAADEAERAEISALLAEENVAELPYEEGDAAAAQALKELDSLTGCPRTDDVLLYAVPVCGPYSALANYKLKVKLTPGTLKKGKAAKQALELLVRGGEVLQRERDLMRAVPDTELVACMVGTVKISASGLQQLKAASKKAKKAAAQSRAKG